MWLPQEAKELIATLTRNEEEVREKRKTKIKQVIGVQLKSTMTFEERIQTCEDKHAPLQSDL